MKTFLLKNFANILTTCNMLCGFLSMMFVSYGNFKFAAYSICIATIFDLWDGRIARRFSFSSPIGKTYDNLADLVSFGMAPSFFFYMILFGPFASPWNVNPLYQVFPIQVGAWVDGTALMLYPAGVLLAFIFAVASAYRLARFYVTDQSNIFIGVPAPVASALTSVLLAFPAIPLSPLFGWVEPSLLALPIPILSAILTFEFPWWMIVFLYLLISYLMIINYSFSKASKSVFSFGVSLGIWGNLKNIFLVLIILFAFKWGLVIALLIYILQPLILQVIKK